MTALSNLYKYFRLLGVIVHEVSHLIGIAVLPGIRPTEIDLTSEVRYEGYITGLKSFIISYMPVFINSVLAFGLFYEASVQTGSSVKGFLLASIIYSVGISISMASIPSYVDATAPLRILLSNLFTLKFPIVIILTPVFVIVSFPFIILSYIMRRLPFISILFRLLYSLVLVALSFMI